MRTFLNLLILKLHRDQSQGRRRKHCWRSKRLGAGWCRRRFSFVRWFPFTSYEW